MSVTGLEEEKQEKKVSLVVMGAIVLLSILLIGGFIWIRRQPSRDPKVVQVKLENAIRPGTPEWEANSKKLILETGPDDKFESPKALGTIWMKIQGTIRNFTGKTLTGLEMRVYVIDLQGKVVKEKTEVTIPGTINGAYIDSLDSNKVIKIPLTLDGFTKNDVRADIKMEVTAFRLQ